MNTLQEATQAKLSDAVDAVVWHIEVDNMTLGDAIEKYLSGSTFGPALVEELQTKVLDKFQEVKPMNEYEQKQQARKERYEELAEKHRQESARRHQAADAISDRIPFGQPILVGHHSEKGHRADIKRIHNHMDKAVEHSATAKYYDQKAASVGKGGVSSDDPEAVQKLQAKLEKLEAHQKYMKTVNKHIRNKDQDKGNAALLAMGITQANIERLRTPDFAGRVGFPSYELTNNNANMRRIRERIEQLKKEATREHKEHEYDGFQVIENTDENRIQFIFPGKPSADVRDTLKRHGFRWSRYNMAWQRQLNNAGIYAAKQVIEAIS